MSDKLTFAEGEEIEYLVRDSDGNYIGKRMFKFTHKPFFPTTKEEFEKKGLRKCPPSKLSSWLFKHRIMTLGHLFYGLESGIKLCCVIEFCFKDIIGGSYQYKGSDECHKNICLQRHCWWHRRNH